MDDLLMDDFHTDDFHMDDLSGFDFHIEDLSGFDLSLFEEHQGAQTPTQSAAGASSRGRGKYSKLDWDGHKTYLQDLYLVQNNSLNETLEKMKEVYAFEATPRAYKDKFKQWGWQKNLPSRHAQFMVHKANNRKRKERKDTIFEYGGQRWNSKRAKISLSRKKKAANDDDVMDMSTPESITYQTPQDVTGVSQSKDSDGDSVEMSIQVPEDEDCSQKSSKPEDQDVLLRWQGHSRTDLDNMWQRGLRLDQQGYQSESERLVMTAHQGMCYILGPTHEDTTKVAYYLANLYTLQSRSSEADSIIEEVTTKHIEMLGYEHKTTQQHIFHCVELLNAWNRSLDALAFINRAKDVSERCQNHQDVRRKGDSQDKGKNASSYNLGSAAMPRTSQLPEIADIGSSQVNCYLDRARLLVRSKDAAAEVFLKDIIRQCLQYHPTFHIEHLRARSELLELYIITNRVHGNFQAFADAKAACVDVLIHYCWEESEFESMEVMERALQVAADILKGGYDRLASPLFRRVSDIATSILGCDDERTIWIRITIGLVYQSLLGWSQAEEWFGNALDGVRHAFGPEDGILLALQRAMDMKVFSVSSRGR